MKSDIYNNGYRRGKQLLGPLHHDLPRHDMKDYLDGFRVGQAEALTRRAGRGFVPYEGPAGPDHRVWYSPV